MAASSVISNCIATTAGIGSRAQSRGKLHRGAEKVVTLGHRLTRGHPNADADGDSAGALGVRESPLDLHGAFDGADYRGEGGHQPVARVLDLRSPMTFEGASHDLVMGSHHRHNGDI